MWINLTGGNNVINFALQLTATLSGAVARLYYVQAKNAAAEKCVRFTAKDGYWVDLPVLPLVLGRLSRTIIALLAERGALPLEGLYSILRNKYWDLSREFTSKEVLRDEYLAPLWKQGLIAEASSGYIVGPQWNLVRPYLELWEEVRKQEITIEQLAQEKLWIEKETIEWER